MKGYKAFNPDWTCRSFQYEVGQETCFSQLNIQGIKPWNDMTVKERYGVINGN